MGPTVWVRLYERRAGRYTDNATGWYPGTRDVMTGALFDISFEKKFYLGLQVATGLQDDAKFRTKKQTNFTSLPPHPVASRFTSIQFLFSTIQL